MLGIYREWGSLEPPPPFILKLAEDREGETVRDEPREVALVISLLLLLPLPNRRFALLAMRSIRFQPDPERC